MTKTVLYLLVGVTFLLAAGSALAQGLPAGQSDVFTQYNPSTGVIGYQDIIPESTSEPSIVYLGAGFPGSTAQPPLVFSEPTGPAGTISDVFGVVINSADPNFGTLAFMSDVTESGVDAAAAALTRISHNWDRKRPSPLA